jgi:ATP-dependent DNA helicase RecQ
MPKKQKKPIQKAVPRAQRASSAKARRPAPKTKPAKTAIKRSVALTARAKVKPPVRAGAKAAARSKQATPQTPAASSKQAKPRKPAAGSKRFAPRKPAKPVVQAKPRTAPVSTLIRPPKPNRAAEARGRGARIVRVAPPPPRTPRPLEELVNLELELKLEKTSAPAAATVERLREPKARPRLTKETWQRIGELAARSQPGGLSEQQRSAIRAALEGQDSLVVIPDDAHAVACYQLSAALLEEPTVVLSPVPSDLQAQSEALAAARKPAVCLLPELSGPERSAALGRIARGGSLLVLLSPEALAAADVRKALAKSGIALFVVEEAHCASDVSHEFRPSFTELGATLRALGKPPVMALTRVATSQVLREVAARLSLTNPVTVQAPAVPGNLRIVTRLARGEQRQAALVRLVERLDLPGLVFCASPHDVDSVYSALKAAHIPAHRYHSGMTPGDRATELLNFTLPNSRSVMVAVSAFAPGSGLPGLGEQASSAANGFGRGRGKRDLRFVVHHQSPASIEQYLREIQRAGGDGLAAICVLFHESSHRSFHEVMLAQQRFRATHLAELARALEAQALEGRSASLESLALATGQSRRTTDRLTALLADAGVISKTGGWVRVATSASDLIEACRALGAKLYALRAQDGDRLSAVSSFAESSDCKLGYLNRYLGLGSHAPCGHCSVCSSELSAMESLPPQVQARRAVVQEFSVRPAASSAPASGPAESGAFAAGFAAGGAPLTAKLADFGAATPRAGR